MMKINQNKKYIHWIGVILVLFMGFIFLSGPDKNPHEFNEAIFSLTRVTIAPLIILVSYTYMVFLIFSKK